MRGGAEAILHSAREVMERCPDKWLLLLDLVNAFNRADRKTGLEEVAREFPEILAWIKTCYGSHSVLLFGDTTILSQIGWHQGDPFASLLFALVLHPIIIKINVVVPMLELNGWFHYDGTQVGTEEELGKVVDIMVTDGPARGLFLSTANTSLEPKSLTWSPHHLGVGDQDPLRRGIPREEGDGVMLLGAPLGRDAFVRKAVEERVRKIEEITTLLPQLEDPQTEFVLLRACLALPKFIYTWRTVDTTDLIFLLERFDRINREALANILGVPLSDQQWQQAKLPVTMGGLGIRGTGPYIATFLASKSLSIALQGCQEEDTPAHLPNSLLTTLTPRFGEEKDVKVEQLETLSQKLMSYKVEQKNLLCLKEGLGQDGRARDVARLASLRLPYDVSWLLATPIPALGLRLRPGEFTMVARSRLGCPVFETDDPCPA